MAGTVEPNRFVTRGGDGGGIRRRQDGGQEVAEFSGTAGDRPEPRNRACHGCATEPFRKLPESG
jgi:hypothetical protein